jgi:hypothetical protein
VICDLEITIPGLAEARKRESESWDEAFIDAPEFICGIEVLPFTLDALALLSGARNAFLKGGPITPGTVALFIWGMSPERVVALRWRNGIELFSRRLGAFVFNRMRKRFVKRLRNLNAEDAATAIEAYLDEALADAPKGGGRGGEAPFWSVYAGVVGLLAGEFGWTEKEIMSMRTKRVFQYLKVARKKLNPDAAMFRPSDRLISLWLTEINERNAAMQQAADTSYEI